MHSITIYCHPAVLYGFLCEEIIDMGIRGLFYGELEAIEGNSWTLSGAMVTLVTSTKPPYLQDITLHSEDENLLCWIRLKFPLPDTASPWP